MAQFAYNNIINASTSHPSFDLNYDFYFQASYKKGVNPCSQSKSINKLVIELGEQITVSKKNTRKYKNFKSSITINISSLEIMRQTRKFN